MTIVTVEVVNVSLYVTVVVSLTYLLIKPLHTRLACRCHWWCAGLSQQTPPRGWSHQYLGPCGACRGCAGVSCLRSQWLSGGPCWGRRCWSVRIRFRRGKEERGREIAGGGGREREREIERGQFDVINWKHSSGKRSRMDIHDGITGFRGAGPHFTFATVEPLMFFRRDCIPRQRQCDCFPMMASVGKRGRPYN